MNRRLKIIAIILAICLVGTVVASAVTAAQYQALKHPKSPYAIPKEYNIRTYFPDWKPSQGDPPKINKYRFDVAAYPEHWSVGLRVDWLYSKYSSACIQLMNNNLDYFTEENLPIIAWVEAELEFLGWPFRNNPLVLEELGLNRDDYLVRK